MIHQAIAVARHELRIVRREAGAYAVLLVMPLLLMAFVKPAFASGRDNGSEQAVPGMAVMFAMFLVGNVGIAFFREHGWGTWNRLRSSWVRPGAIMAGKTVGPLLLLLTQLAILLGVGGLVFDLRVRGDVLALVAVGLAFAVTLVALAVCLVGLCRSVMQLNALTNVGTLLLAGLGGALTPLSSLPDWARTLSPLTPSYWAMRGFQDVIVDGAGLGGVLGPIGMLSVFATVSVVLAMRSFRFESSKVHWS